MDGVYLGKAFSCLIGSEKNRQGNVEDKDSEDKVILFWHIFCLDSFERGIAHVDYKQLPVGSHKYFETDFQLLDR